MEGKKARIKLQKLILCAPCIMWFWLAVHCSRYIVFSQGCVLQKLTLCVIHLVWIFDHLSSGLLHSCLGIRTLFPQHQKAIKKLRTKRTLQTCIKHCNANRIMHRTQMETSCENFRRDLIIFLSTCWNVVYLVMRFQLFKLWNSKY